MKQKRHTDNQIKHFNSENKKKGNLVEEIVAMLHELPGIKVERNAFLPVLNNHKRKREIDILLKASIDIYPVRIAIECKNKSAKIGVDYIDSFVGKLDDIGIPCQHGIFISTSGYTNGALDRAKANGIRTLQMTGLTEDRLSSLISEAWQYIVFLLPVVKSVTITNNIAKASEDIFGFFNEKREICGLFPDLIWFKWQEGEIDPTLGEQEIDLQMPLGWQQIINGKPETPLTLKTMVEIVGIVFQLSGKVRNHSLVDAFTKKAEKKRLDVDFDIEQLQDSQLDLKHFFTENDLQDWIKEHRGTRVINRIQMPRIQYMNKFYYPMSERVAGIVMNQILAYDAGKISDFPIFNFNEIEGADIKTVWEPIWQGHYHLWSRTT